MGSDRSERRGREPPGDSALPFEVVAGLVQGALEGTADARVQNYRVLLAERAARAELRYLTAAEGSRAFGRPLESENDARSRRLI
jgi:hypothetical protein